MEEREELSRALLGIREVLASIDAQIDEQDKHEQLLEIYQKVDGKSCGHLDKKPFKVSSYLFPTCNFRSADRTQCCVVFFVEV